MGEIGSVGRGVWGGWFLWGFWGLLRGVSLRGVVVVVMPLWPEGCFSEGMKVLAFVCHRFVECFWGGEAIVVQSQW